MDGILPGGACQGECLWDHEHEAKRFIPVLAVLISSVKKKEE